MSATTGKWQFVSESTSETFELGKRIGATISASTMVGLNGTLGSGKTKLTQGIVCAVMGKDEVVVSPTFTLCIPYSGRINLWHLDAYRIQSDEEVFELGLDEAIEEGTSIIIEWIDRIRELAPPLDIVIQIDHESESKRTLELEAFSDAGRQLINNLQNFGEMEGG